MTRKIAKPPKVDFENTEPAADITSKEDIKPDELLVLTEDFTPQSQLHKSTQKQKEDTRTRFALFFVGGFFLMLLFAMAVGVFVNVDKVKITIELLLTISGILSGPLGFIVGYYFKSEEEKQRGGR